MSKKVNSSIKNGKKVSTNVPKQFEKVIKENIALIWLVDIQKVAHSLGISYDLAREHCEKILVEDTRRIKQQFKDINIRDIK